MNLHIYLYLILFVVVFTTFACVNDHEKIPSDVMGFRKRRDFCDHFRGEPMYNEERRKFLIAKIKETCTGTDNELAVLKEKYESNKKIMDILNQYEDDIEP